MSNVITYLVYVTAILSIITFIAFKKTRKYFAIAFGLYCVFCFVCITWGDQLFFYKSDAKAILEQDGIDLKDDFKIISHESQGLGDFIEFKLLISHADKELFTQTLKKSRYFNDSANAEKFFKIAKERTVSPPVYLDSDTGGFSRRVYQKDTGCTASFESIWIWENSDTLIYQCSDVSLW